MRRRIASGPSSAGNCVAKTNWSDQDSVAHRLLLEMGSLYNTWIEDFREKQVPLAVGREALMHAATFFAASVIAELNQDLTPEMIEAAKQKFVQALEHNHAEIMREKSV